MLQSSLSKNLVKLTVAKV